MKRMYIVIAAIVGIMLIASLARSQNNDSTDTKTDQAASQESAPEPDVVQKQNEEEAKKEYVYAAQKGDSYSLMARKAVQNYAAEAKVTLTNAQIIFAETNLAQLAKSPLLEIGQQVSFIKENLKGWLDKAKQLTPDQEARWNVFTKNVNFDTSEVGQAK